MVFKLKVIISFLYNVGNKSTYGGEEMRFFYDKINSILDFIDFEKIYPGFHKFNFALYNDETIWLKDREIPQQGFFGNTSIEFEGEQIAIWNVTEKIEDIDTDLFVAGMVHEMFHAYQMTENFIPEPPNDLKLLQYPNSCDNFLLKQAENNLLSESVKASKERRIEIYKTVMASRSLRELKIGEMVKQENLIELWEGGAECCGLLALKQLSPEKFEKKLEDYADILSEGSVLFDVRRSGYYSGTFMRLLEREIGNEETPLEKNLKKDFEEKRKTVDAFFGIQRERHEAEGYICGYDPMNQFRFEDKLYAKNIMFINVNDEIIKLEGPVLVELKPESANLTIAYWS